MFPFDGGLTGTENGTLLFSILFAASYLFYSHRRFSAGRVAAKTGSVAFLALLSFLEGGPVLLTIALLLCAAGDFFLAMEERNARLFDAGLGAFFVGHLFYVALFLAMPPPAEPLSYAVRIGSGVVMAVVGLGMAPRLWQTTGPLRIPIMAYIAVILAMGFSAVENGAALIIAGAMSFVVSDAILAWERFILKEGPAKQIAGPVVWITYYTAQILIVLGVLSET